MKNRKCNNCGKTIIKDKRGVLAFCGRECEKEYKYKSSHTEKACPICGDTFVTTPSRGKIFCSLGCQIEWQRRFPIKGKDHQSYRHDLNHTLTCEWCKKEVEVGAYKISHGARFCSLSCRRVWFAKVWSQQEDWKKNRRDWAISQMENGSSFKNDSAPQLAIDFVLDNLGISYEKEKRFGNFCVDNYLNDCNLIIEVMGTFFHCDNRKFQTIQYTNQVDRIKRDKAKHSYIVNYFGINVLYLWEDDITKNTGLCSSLIREYVRNDGILPNYHSVNYFLDDHKNLCVIKNINIPYMEWDIRDLNKIIDTSIKEKMSRKQNDKWITFNCEYCGIEKEELIVHYKKSKNHFCSQNCFNEFKKEKNATSLRNTTIETSLND